MREAIKTGSSDESPAAMRRDDTGEFGQWIHHDISSEDKASPHHPAATELHARFHIQAAKILELVLAGQARQAAEAFGAGSEFAGTAMAFDSELIAWYIDSLTRESASERVVSAEKTKTILDERARALAKSTQVQTGATLPLVVFSLATEAYGIATGYVREVQPLHDLTPVPCTPSFVAGVINVRGSIYSVVDIRSFVGAPEQGIGAATTVILVDAAGLQVGILADEVSGATNVAVNDIKPPPAALKDGYIQGVTKDMLILLDLEALLRDARIIVREEVA